MQCTQCGHDNQSGKFCVNCGSKLEASAATEASNSPLSQPVSPALSAQPVQYNTPSQMNPQLQQVKEMGGQYFSFFYQVLRNPVRVAETTNAGHMANAIITLVLFCLLLPLTAYFQLRAAYGFFGDSVPFGGIVIKPFFFLLLIVLMVNSIIFLVLKLGNVNADYRDVTARFGTLMTPSVTFIFAAFLFSIIQFDSEWWVGLRAWEFSHGWWRSVSRSTASRKVTQVVWMRSGELSSPTRHPSLLCTCSEIVL
ncbi:hypothetical protein SD71_02385 [Cohnella kolymensis]|uniref:Zinc-ribbon domain-containing protein n=1 Tax=Cohnella kolymensis TaxID=1590652 RepID=A0ABR5A8Y3_9BACL|nr:zinc ribbon domain-containing protein [Cohnella kolymensis]KIL37500.1 hypothetical protein SD71_02385 [Cohnella kolymensis]